MAKSLEEQANELLRDLALSRGESLRQLGIIDARRQRTISSHEYPMSQSWSWMKNRFGFPAETEDPDEEE